MLQDPHMVPSVYNKMSRRCLDDIILHIWARVLSGRRSYTAIELASLSPVCGTKDSSVLQDPHMVPSVYNKMSRRCLDDIILHIWGPSAKWETIVY